MTTISQPAYRVSVSIALIVLLMGILSMAADATHFAQNRYVVAYRPNASIVSVAPDVVYNFAPQTLTIQGSQLADVATVHLNNLPLLDVSIVGSDVITAVVPPHLSVGVYTVTVGFSDNTSVSIQNALTVALGGDGSLGEWTAQSSLTKGRVSPAVVQYSDWVYVLGGSDGYALATVEVARINDDGTLDEWQFTSPMLSARVGFAAVAIDGFLFAIGGQGGVGIGSQKSVERARINADGTLGDWSHVETLVDSRVGLAAISTEKSIYVLGGANDSGYLKSVEMATVNPDGTLGAWQVVSQMTTPRAMHSALRVGASIVVLGGSQNYDDNGVLRGRYLSSTEMSAILPDGSLGPWRTTTAMTTPRARFSAATARGYVYVFGGENDTSGFLSDIERAQVSVNENLGAWDGLAKLEEGIQAQKSFVGGGAIYLVGGATNKVYGSSRVERATVAPLSVHGIVPKFLSIDSPTVLSVTGGNFLPTASLDVGSVTVPLEISSSSQATATVDVTHLAIGWHAVRVQNGDTQTFALPFGLRVDGVGPVAVDGHGLTINNGALFTNQTSVTLTISSETDTALMQISNDGGFADSQWEIYQSHKSWEITQYGSYVLPRSVYLRYKDLDGNVSPTVSDDIILDVNPPTGSVVLLDALSNRATESNTATVILHATDDVSGVSAYRISNSPDLGMAEWLPYTESRSWVLDGGRSVHVQYQDNAGNVSQVYSSGPPPAVFLPVIVRPN